MDSITSWLFYFNKKRKIYMFVYILYSRSDFKLSEEIGENETPQRTYLE